MFKGKFLVLVSVVALVYTEVEEDCMEENSISENVTTESYQTSFVKEEVIDAKPVHKNDFKAEPSQYSEKVPCNVTASDCEDQPGETGTEDPLEDDLEKAKEEIKAWAQKLDCRTSSFGALNCFMIKRVIKNFIENMGEFDSAIVSARIKRFVDKIEADDKQDPELKNLVRKYKKYLVNS